MIKTIYEIFLNPVTEFYKIFRMNTDNVMCPEELKQNDFVKFAVGDKSSGSISIENEGLGIKLRFNGNQTDCYFPWNSIVTIEGPECQFTTSANFDYSIKSPEMYLGTAVISGELAQEHPEYFLKETKYPHLKILTKTEL